MNNLVEQHHSSRSVARDPFVWGAVVLLIVVVTCVLWIFIVVSRKLPTDSDDPFLLLYFAARLMQITLGMLIGLILTLFGVIMAWFGVTQDLNTEVNAQTFKMKLASAGPGALLVVCGSAIILFCISLKLEIRNPSGPNHNSPTYSQEK